MILFQKITDILQITDKLTDKLIYKFILLDKAWTPRFCAGSKPTRVPEICDSKNVWQWSCLEIRLIALRLSTIPRKTIQFITVAYKSLKIIFQKQPLRKDVFQNIAKFTRK